MQEQDDSSANYQIKDIKSNVNEFIDYWKKIDIIKQFNSTEIELVLNQWVRKSIINILSEGREIEIEGDPKKIYVLNANELLERVNREATLNEDRKKVKKSNLYFHLNKLEEGGLIQTVGYIPVKNRLISYYGRTARVFLIDFDEDKTQKSILNQTELIDLIENINPSVKRDQIEDITAKLNKLLYRKIDNSAITKWIETHETELRESDIDIRHLHEIFHKALLFNDETINTLREFTQILDINFD